MKTPNKTTKELIEITSMANLYTNNEKDWKNFRNRMIAFHNILLTEWADRVEGKKITQFSSKTPNIEDYNNALTDIAADLRSNVIK